MHHSPTEGAYSKTASMMGRNRISQLKPVHSWVLPVVINGVHTNALLDTGAGCCLLSKAVFEPMSRSRHPLNTRPRDINAVGKHILPTIGDLICNVTINGRQFPIEMVVSTENETIGCILGMDFINTHFCEFVLRTGNLLIDNMKIKLMRESAATCVAQIKLDSGVTLPPRTELTVSGRPEHIKRRINTYYS